MRETSPCKESVLRKPKRNRRGEVSRIQFSVKTKWMQWVREMGCIIARDGLEINFRELSRKYISGLRLLE